MPIHRVARDGGGGTRSGGRRERARRLRAFDDRGRVSFARRRVGRDGEVSGRRRGDSVVDFVDGAALRRRLRDVEQGRLPGARGVGRRALRAGTESFVGAVFFARSGRAAEIRGGSRDPVAGRGGPIARAGPRVLPSAVRNARRRVARAAPLRAHVRAGEAAELVRGVGPGLGGGPLGRGPALFWLARGGVASASRSGRRRRPSRPRRSAAPARGP